MSGPKIVRIVTREELIELCEGQLVGLEAALQRWQRVGHRNDVIDETDVQLVRKRLFAIRSLLANDQFVELQKQVPAEIAFLAADIERRIAKAADAEALVRKNKRRATSIAQSLKQALISKGIEVPNAFKTLGKETPDALIKAITEAFALLATESRIEGLTERQKDLAVYLGGGEDRQTLAEWITAETISSNTPALATCERMVDELSALDQGTASAFYIRLAAIVEENREARQGLLIDSLVLDVSAAHKNAIFRMGITMNLEVIAAELSTLADPVATAKAIEIASLLSQNAKIADLSASLQRSQQILDEVRARNAGFHRRSVLLSGLSQMGYEVHEGLETAWVRDGKITLRDKASPTYGVEVGGDPNGMVQMRTVAFDVPGTARNAKEDVAAEESFCDAFVDLSADLAANGGRISVVKAVGVGVAPLKVVPFSMDSEDSSNSTRDMGTLQRR